MKNKKMLIHFTLAVGLIVGICVTAKSRPAQISTSTYSSYQDTYSAKVTDVWDDFNTNSNEPEINSEDINYNLNDLEANSSNDLEANSSETIADIRSDFDVSSPDQVKNAQKILGLEQDGIFGPRTDKAYQAAIAQDDLKKSSPLINVEIVKTAPTETEAVNNVSSPLSTANTMLD